MFDQQILNTYAIAMKGRKTPENLIVNYLMSRLALNCRSTITLIAKGRSLSSARDFQATLIMKTPQLSSYLRILKTPHSRKTRELMRTSLRISKSLSSPIMKIISSPSKKVWQYLNQRLVIGNQPGANVSRLKNKTLMSMS
jgi:hypothetical protein